MEQGVRAQEVSLRALLSENERFRMPPYQRSYSWGLIETEALLSDLLTARHTASLHFMGAIVVVNGVMGGAAEIVDGQQRLTTLTMLLAVLRDLDAEPVHKQACHRLLTTATTSSTESESSWRLTLNHIDNPFFRANVQTPGATLTIETKDIETESQQRMSDCIVLMRERLQEMSNADRRSFAQFIPDHVVLVRVRVSDRESGYGVFRVLNTRGKQPFAHDIIKTEVLERADLDLEEAEGFSRAWSTYEARLGAKNFDELLRQVRTLHDRSARGDVLAGFRKLLESDLDPRRFLEVLLPRYVNAHDELTTGQSRLSHKASAATMHLNHLRALDHEGWRAPALKYLVEHRGDDALDKSFFEALERLAFAMQFIISERDTRTRRYRRVVDRLDSQEDLFSDDSPLQLSVDEKRRLRERLLGRFGSFGQRRALALRLNSVVPNGEALAPEDDATVEHVLPRNPAKNSRWMKTWSKLAERRELCDTIGNLVLLPYDVNQEADRMDYKDKITIFKTEEGSRFALTRDMLKQRDWTPRSVRSRTEKLAQLLAKAWQL